MQVSQDFAGALREIRQHIDVLTRENLALKQELAEVRKIATSAQTASVTQRRALTMQAIARQDPEQMRHLSNTAADPIDAELLRLFAPVEDTVPAQLNVNPEHVAQLLANFRQDPLVPQQAPLDEEAARTQRISQAYGQMQANQENQRVQRLSSERIAELKRIAAEKIARKENGRRFGLNEDEWF